jgi:molybdopterin converting factor small subunit
MKPFARRHVQMIITYFSWICRLKVQFCREKAYEAVYSISLCQLIEVGLQMRIKVHYLSLVKSFTKTSQDEFDVKEATSLSEVLYDVAEKYGKPFTQEVYDPEHKEMKATFVAMVNGVLMDQLQGVNTPLKNGDNVIIMSLMTGG